MARSMLQVTRPRRTPHAFLPLAAALALAPLAPGAAAAKVWVIPHVLETSGRVHDTQYTFDTTIFANYVGGIGTVTGSGGATVDVYLYNNTGGPLTNNGAVVCAPCTYNLGADTRKASISVDDLILTRGAFDAGVKLGFGIIVVGGANPENVALQGFVVNSHTGPFDLSTAAIGPHVLGHLCDDETPPTGARVFVLPHVLEKSGQTSNTQFTFDTTIFANYVGGLAGIPIGSTGGASVDLYLYDEEGHAATSATGQNVCAPCTIQLSDVTRKASLNIENLMLAQGGMPADEFTGFGVIVVGGDVGNVNLQGFVVNAHTGPLDVSVFGFDPVPISAAAAVAVPPGGEALLGAMQVVPNPARAGAAMSFALARAMDVDLAIYDVNGRKVAAVWSGRKEAGAQTLAWNGRTDEGTLAPAGVYFARLTGEGVTMENRVIALR